ncbi:TPA: hypothetical protein MXV30_004524 [Pseudomonas aeruginosa]|nr:hypothetical protein [Pseudomonas aeruginosa]
MSKHTPGPWRLDKWGSLQTEGGQNVLLRGITTISSGSDEVIAEAEANTRLTSAAPELLEALENLMAAYSQPEDRICCNGVDCGCMGATTYQQAEHYARAAIAKATA